MKKKKIRNTILIFIDVIIVIIAGYFVIGYFNFYKISHEEKPLFEITTYDYDSDTNNDVVTVHDYKIYKIVAVETITPKKAINYSMKLWFMEDVK